MFVRPADRARFAVREVGGEARCGAGHERGERRVCFALPGGRSLGCLHQLRPEALHCGPPFTTPGGRLEGRIAAGTGGELFVHQRQLGDGGVDGLASGRGLGRSFDLGAVEVGDARDQIVGGSPGGDVAVGFVGLQLQGGPICRCGCEIGRLDAQCVTFGRELDQALADLARLRLEGHATGGQGPQLDTLAFQTGLFGLEGLDGRRPGGRLLQQSADRVWGDRGQDRRPAGEQSPTRLVDRAPHLVDLGSPPIEGRRELIALVDRIAEPDDTASITDADRTGVHLRGPCVEPAQFDQCRAPLLERLALGLGSFQM